LRAGNLPTAPAINNPASSTAAGEATGKATSNADGQAKEQKKLDKGKQKADSGDRKPSESESKYVQILKKQQQEKKDERARILKRVEDDKIQRRQAAAERKAEAERAKDKPKEPAEVGSNRPAPRKSRQYEECALQIRLFDGSTIRSRFPSSATLRVDVRPWIDQHQDGNTAYTFKEVLTPLPNKNITISDEEQSLQSQGLVPSATLIIVPVQGSISAYDSSGGTGLVSRGVSAGYGLASWGTGMVTGLVGSLIGAGPAAQPQEEQSSAPVSTDPSTSRINVRTLRDQDRRDDQQFYNGNAVSKSALCI
jgi:UBX domain